MRILLGTNLMDMDHLTKQNYVRSFVADEQPTTHMVKFEMKAVSGS